MGFILECRDAGIPEELLIPIQPPYRNLRTGDLEGGKAPAVPNAIGEWIGLADWNKLTTPWSAKEAADAQGSNCGLILGCSGNTPTGPVAFAAIDIDLMKGQEKQRDLLLNYIASTWPNAKLLVRETVPWRAMVLVRIKDTFSTGRKTVYFLQLHGQEIGKIELLTTDQQCVIAGNHAIGGLIQWFIHGSDEKWRTPRIVEGMAAFDTFSDLAEDIRNRLEDIKSLGYLYESSSLGRGELVPDAALVPPWLTLDVLIRYIDETPNTVDMDRDQYVAFMQAIAACKHGLEVRHGVFTPEQLDRLTTHAAEWAAKWPGYKGVENPYSVERAKCENDWFKQRGGFSTSWYRLVTLASEFGYSSAAADSAQLEFAQFVNPAERAPLPETEAHLNTVHKDQTLDVPYIEGDITSDQTLGDYLSYNTGLGQILAFHHRQWHVWDEKVGWKITSEQYDAENAVRRKVAPEIAKYIKRFNSPEQPWTAAQVSAMRSEHKKSCVIKVMETNLTKEGDMVKSSIHHLQTPIGTYDLRTMKQINMLDRKEQYNTRYTGVQPDFDNLNTPLFDSLLFGLADGNSEVVQWMWHYLGYCLLGDPRTDCFVMIWGSGGNGKSVLLKVLAFILGNYQVGLNSKVLLESGKDLHPTSLVKLYGKRLAMVSEMSHKDRWNESLLKQITGGDTIQAREMNKPEFEFKSEAGLLIVCNEIPTFSRVTPALLRRFRIIGTTRQPEVPDLSLEEKIKTWEAPSVLAKLMLYANKVWNANGAPHEHIILPPVPAAMKAESEAVMKDTDPLYAWLAAECDWGPAFSQCEEEISVLLDRFRAWTTRNGKGAGGVVGDNINEKAFREALRRMSVSLTDDTGTPLRKTIRSGAGQTIVNVGRGIRLKVRAVS